MRKIFVSLLTLTAIYSFASADSAMASPWQNWLNWGKPKAECSSMVSNSAAQNVLDKAQKDFAGYLDVRKHLPGTKPPAPVDPIRQDTTLHEVFYGFSYWWVPGNEWHSVMMRDQPRLGVFMQMDAQRDGIQIPHISHKPQIEGPFPVPHSLAIDESTDKPE